MANTGALEVLISQRFGIPTRPVINRLVSDADSAAKECLPNNPNRVAFVVVNFSANNVWILPRGDVSSTQGIPVPANGGTVVSLWDEDFHLTGMSWHCIASADDSAIMTLEIEGY